MEVPALKSVADRHRGDGLAVLAVNAWDEPLDLVQGFVKAQGINYTVLLDGGETAIGKYGVRGVPSAFYLDRQGRIVETGLGAEPEPEIEAKVKTILKS